MAKHSYPVPGILDGFQRNGMIAAVLGLVLTIAGYFIASPDQFFHSYLLGFMVFFGLCMGCLGLLLLQYLSGGAWGILGRRIFEAGSRLIPIALLLFLPIVIGLKHIYMWTYPNEISNLAIVKAKTGYLNVPFFLIRAALYFAFAIGVQYILNKYSRKQDETGDYYWARKLENFSGGGLLFFFLAMTFCSVDWLMSLSPEWYSTMFAFFFVVGQAIAALTFTIIILVMLSRTEPMSGILQKTHLHDLGKLLFAFNFLWGYLVFCQWLITYSGNLPEEINWYLNRINGGWEYVAYLIIFVHFILPFALLLSRSLKRTAKPLMIVAALLFVMRIVDMYWLIEPNFHRAHFFLSWTDITAPLGFFGLFVYLFMWQYKKNTLLPEGEPELELALHPKGAH